MMYDGCLSFYRYPTEQTSRPIKLEQGNFYFMESFMKEGTGGDNLSIGVRFPDGKTEMPIFNNLYLIPGKTSIIYTQSLNGLYKIFANNRKSGTTCTRVISL